MHNELGEDEHGTPMLRWVGLAGGVLAAFVVYAVVSTFWGPGSVGGAGPLAQPQVSAAGCRVAGIAALMGVWWLTEAIPLAATAMLPLVLFPILRIMPVKDAAAPFGDDLIFLFLGGFMLQLAMERWGLHRRIALVIILFVGTRPARLVAGIMLATAVLSMWISNAASAAMMLPIGMSLCQLVAARAGGAARAAGAEQPIDVPGHPQLRVRNLGRCVMIGIAWAATIGGIATPIGTAPNVMLRGYLNSAGLASPTFAQWMMLCGPMAAGFLVLAWVLLTRVFFPVGGGSPRDAERTEAADERRLLRAELAGLGPVKVGEWATMAIFSLAVVGWLFSDPISHLLGVVRTTGTGPDAKSVPLITDAVVAMVAGLLVFVIPVSIKPQVFVLDWKHASRVPYGVLLLFGGGLALAKGIDVTGLDDALGNAMHGMRGMHPLVVTLVVCATTVFLSEFMSNTALTAALLPIVGSVAAALSMEPLWLLLPMTMGASCAFMMPAGTPPSAITFSSGYYTIRDMAKTGLVMNLIGVLLISVMVYTGLRVVMGR